MLLKTSFISLLLLLTIIFEYASLAAGNVIRVENNIFFLEFDPESSALISLTDKITNFNLVGDAALSTPLYRLKFVDQHGELGFDPVDAISTFENIEDDSKHYLILKWKNCNIYRGSKTDELIAKIEVSLKITLIDDMPTSSWKLSFEIMEGGPIGLWEALISLPLDADASTTNGELFYPGGFGLTFLNPVTTTGGAWQEMYPGGGASFQYMALGNVNRSTAAYMSALDGTGSPKLIQYSTLEGYSTAHNIEMAASASHIPTSGKDKLSKPHFPTWRRTAADKSFSALSITIYPADAGMPLSAGTIWAAPYDIAVGIIQNVSAKNGRPMWYEAAMMYRPWALKEAEWTVKGPLAVSKSPLPGWYTQNNVWLNTHWQCHDIFNETGGEPSFVLDNTLAIADRLNQTSLALHWYEWQQGPNPDPAARYLFDTHYPDYFPPRNNFLSSVQKLQSRKISIFPYINGRIFDIHSDSYKESNGDQYCSKKAPVRMLNPNHPSYLESYVETYGSNASFCVTNPFTHFWQKKIADVVNELVSKWKVAGVYIDQLGSAVPKLCWDSDHGHTLGGGDFWRQGYLSMMNMISKELKASSIDQREAVAPMVTEDNSEPFMDMVQGYLTLTAFRGALAQSTSGETVAYKRTVNAFPAIYGGYYVGFGAEWFKADFDDHDWWCGKLATHFAAGVQLGWFSLVGMANDTQDGCGEMGVGDLLMSGINDDLVSFLQLLAKSRGFINHYFLDGHLIRSSVLNPEPPAIRQKTSSGGRPLLDYDTVARSAWKLDSDKSTLLVLIGTTMKSFSTSVIVDFEAWSYDSNATLRVESIDLNGKYEFIENITGPLKDISVIVPGRGLLMLRFSLV